MDDKEKEYKKAFKFIKRWSKAPSTLSYTIGYSAGNGDKEPAAKTYKYVLELEKDNSISYKEKLIVLDDFLEEMNKEERLKKMMVTSYYNNIKRYIKKSMKDVEEGIPVQTRRK
ncbi:hypothetical protein [Senegalia massiliensis]|uniref:hypothetical protein n=1 Tax=Senegalia massiliensis TaxID=1720316 RepID=UPI0010304FCD|nr:hypothetical protein [Senegalia massiliensis]